MLGPGARSGSARYEKPFVLFLQHHQSLALGEDDAAECRQIFAAHGISVRRMRPVRRDRQAREVAPS